jgi:hypothetical protein
MNTQTSSTQDDDFDFDLAGFFARNGITVEHTFRPATAEDVSVAAAHAAAREADEAWLDQQAEADWLAWQ